MPKKKHGYTKRSKFLLNSKGKGRLPYQPNRLDYFNARGLRFHGTINNGTDFPSNPLELNAAWTNTFNGSQNPNWKNLVRANVNATTPADGSLTRITSQPFIDSVWHFRGFNDIIYYNSGWPTEAWIGLPVAGAPPDVQSRVYARAASQFIDKCKSSLSSFESGQDLGEIKQTIEAIVHPMKSLKEHVLSYFSSVKKLKNRYKKVPSLRNALTDTYLEWTFGWNPLAADISDGIAGLTHQRMPYQPVEAYAKEKFQHDQGLDSEVTHTFGGYRATHTITGEYSVRLKGVVNAYYRGGPPSLQQELQLLPEDFLPTAWDLLPYSFVVDYFTNVGDIIKAVSFPSAALRWCNGSFRDMRTLTQVYTPLTNEELGLDASYSHEVWFARNMVAESKNFSRNYIAPSGLVATLQFSLPVSAKPWENIAALISGRKKSLTPLW
jgi:hypothetical protein